MDNAKTTQVTTGAAPLHCHRASMVIECELQAVESLDRIQGGMAQPDELAAIVTYLHRELQHGFSHLVQKTLERRHD